MAKEFQCTTCHGNNVFDQHYCEDCASECNVEEVEVEDEDEDEYDFNYVGPRPHY